MKFPWFNGGLTKEKAGTAVKFLGIAMKQERCNLENGAFAGGQPFTDNDFH